MFFSGYFNTIPDGGRTDGRLEKSILRLTQPSLAGTWAELGNNAINYGLLSADGWRTHSTRTKIKVVFWLLKNLRESYIFLFIFHVHINVRSANDYFFLNHLQSWVLLYYGQHSLKNDWKFGWVECVRPLEQLNAGECLWIKKWINIFIDQQF